MKKLLFVLVWFMLFACGKSKQEKINEIKFRIERLNELKNLSNDSLVKIRNNHTQLSDRFIDSLMNCGRLSFVSPEFIVATTIKINNSDSSIVNRIESNLKNIDVKIEENNSQLDLLLNLK